MPLFISGGFGLGLDLGLVIIGLDLGLVIMVLILRIWSCLHRWLRQRFGIEDMLKVVQISRLQWYNNA